MSWKNAKIVKLILLLQCAVLPIYTAVSSETLSVSNFENAMDGVGVPTTSSARNYDEGYVVHIRGVRDNATENVPLEEYPLDVSEKGSNQSYNIEAILDEKRHVVDGFAKIRWQNNSVTDAHEIFFHLYLNAFSHPRTVFMREGGEKIGNRQLQIPGRIEILSLRTIDGINLIQMTRTNLHEDDATQMKVLLPHHISPGGKIELEIRFRSYLPQIVARTGYYEKFHMIAQWFPKIARREPDGNWITFPYHGLGEFYEDFAEYTVKIDIPDEYLVGSTGKLVESWKEGTRRIEVYHVNNVHDFAWCAYPLFREYLFNSNNIKVRILAPYDYSRIIGILYTAIHSGLQYFGRVFGDYPYEYLTVIIPPKGAEGLLGMEYPTLFVTSIPWYASPNLGAFYPLFQKVTIHELAHQWFQGIIANNELYTPILDEGLAHFATFDLLRVIYGCHNSGFSLGKITIDVFELARAQYFWRRAKYPSSLFSADSYSYANLLYSVYLRPALVLETIRRTWGEERFRNTIGYYTRHYRFKYPKTEDLFSVFDKFYRPNFSKQVLIPALRGDTSFDAKITGYQSTKKENRWHFSLTAERMGNIYIPSWILIQNIQGEKRTILWDSGQSQFSTTITDDVPISTVILDPDRKNLLDSSILDNRITNSKTKYVNLSKFIPLGQLLLTFLGP